MSGFCGGSGFGAGSGLAGGGVSFTGSHTTSFSSTGLVCCGAGAGLAWAGFVGGCLAGAALAGGAAAAGGGADGASPSSLDPSSLSEPQLAPLGLPKFICFLTWTGAACSVVSLGVSCLSPGFLGILRSRCERCFGLSPDCWRALLSVVDHPPLGGLWRESTT